MCRTESFRRAEATGDAFDTPMRYKGPLAITAGRKPSLPPRATVSMHDDYAKGVIRLPCGTPVAMAALIWCQRQLKGENAAIRPRGLQIEIATHGGRQLFTKV
jgi:hypothetical protein